jgi:hypothetical protein
MFYCNTTTTNVVKKQHKTKCKRNKVSLSALFAVILTYYLLKLQHNVILFHTYKDV